MDFDPKKDYYKLLDIQENANEDDIKKAFRKLAIQHHPDKWWSKEKFQEINEAYQTLSDSKKRKQYDMYRKWWFDQSWDFWWFGWFWWFGDFQVDISDIMWDLFGWWSRTQNNNKWEDLQISLVISFDDAYLGSTKTITYNKKVIDSDIKSSKCSSCAGRWVVSQQARTPFGVFQTQSACSNCMWSWFVYSKDWKKVSDWLSSSKQTIDVKIPAGIKDGVYIKFAWRWSDSIRWSSWDLYVKISIKSSEIFSRKWDDIFVNINVTIFDLVLWWDVEVPHPDWKFKLKVPKWTQINSKIKIIGKWFWEKWFFGHRWDMYVIPNLEIPKKITKEQENLWQKLKDIS